MRYLSENENFNLILLMLKQEFRMKLNLANFKI